MQKLSVLVSIPLVLTACNIGHAPEYSLKKPWSQALEDTHPSKIPYALVYQIGSKRLIYVAAASDHRAQSNYIIESQIARLKPEVILLQGHEEGLDVHPSKVPFRLGAHRPLIKGASASREDILDHLSEKGITERDYVIYQVLLLANQRMQFVAKSTDELRKRIAHHLVSDRNTQKHKLSLKDIENWYAHKTGHSLTDDQLLDGELVAPKDPRLKTTTYLQKLAFYEDEIDDEVVLDTLSEELDEYDTVMIIRAPSKYVIERDVLHSLFNVKQPKEIIN